MSEAVEYRELDEYAGLFAGSDGNIYLVTDSEIVNGIRYVQLARMKTCRSGPYETVRAMRRADLAEVTANVHTLICGAFHARPKGISHIHVRHLNGDSHDNRACNLAYGTPRENWEDKILVNTATIGEKNGMAKLTDEQRATICDMFRRGQSQNALARQYGVTQSAICKIIAARQAYDVLNRMTTKQLKGFRGMRQQDAVRIFMDEYGLTLAAAKKAVTECLPKYDGRNDLSTK